MTLNSQIYFYKKYPEINMPISQFENKTDRDSSTNNKMSIEQFIEIICTSLNIARKTSDEMGDGIFFQSVARAIYDVNDNYLNSLIDEIIRINNRRSARGYWKQTNDQYDAIINIAEEKWKAGNDLWHWEIARTLVDSYPEFNLSYTGLKKRLKPLAIKYNRFFDPNRNSKDK